MSNNEMGMGSLLGEMLRGMLINGLKKETEQRIDEIIFIKTEGLREAERKRTIEFLEKFNTAKTQCFGDNPENIPEDMKDMIAEDEEWANTMLVKVKSLKLDDDSSFKAVLDMAMKSTKDNIEALHTVKGLISEEEYNNLKQQVINDYNKLFSPEKIEIAKKNGTYAPSEKYYPMADQIVKDMNEMLSKL